MILHLIGRRGCINIEVLVRNTNVKFLTCRDRLNSLVKKGYLCSQIVQVKKLGSRRIQEPIFYLSKEAKKFFNQAEWEMLQKKPPVLSQIDHMLKTSDIIDTLAKRNNILSYETEISLRSRTFLQGLHEGIKLADLSVTTDNGVTFIEIDSVNYTGVKLAEKVRGLSELKTIWVVYSEARFDTVVYASRNSDRITVVHFNNLSTVLI